VHAVAEALTQGVAHSLLVLGMAVGVQQAHGDGLGLAARDLVRERRRRVARQLGQHAVGAHALGRAEPPLGRHERRGMGGAQAVELAPRLAAELDHVGEPLRGDERGPGARALEQRVRRHGHAVREHLDVAGLRARRLERRPDRVHHALGLIARRGRRLGGVQPPAGHEDRVRERAADVDPEQHGAQRTAAAPGGAAARSR